MEEVPFKEDAVPLHSQDRFTTALIQALLISWGFHYPKMTEIQTACGRGDAAEKVIHFFCAIKSTWYYPAYLLTLTWTSISVSKIRYSKLSLFLNLMLTSFSFLVISLSPRGRLKRLTIPWCHERRDYTTGIKLDLLFHQKSKIRYESHMLLIYQDLKSGCQDGATP